MTCFGQAVIGAPGAGKSSYCRELSAHLTRLGRHNLTINLDPGEESDFAWSLDIRDLIKTDEVMEKTGLGPNGALLHAMEYVDKNWIWVADQIAAECAEAKKIEKSHPYLIFDFPGQIELFTTGDSVRNIMKKLEKSGHRLAVVQLIDSLYCSEPSKFIPAVLTSLSAMIRLEMPHINILSKIDAVESSGSLKFGIEYFTEVMDLKWMVDTISEQETLEKVLAAADKANGHFMGSEERTIRSMLECAMAGDERDTTLQHLKEKYRI